MGNGSRAGQVSRAGEGAEGLMDGGECYATRAFSAPPSAFTVSPRTRRRMSSQPVVRDSPVILDVALPSDGTDQAPTSLTDSDQSSGYEPPTYRTRRRSASVASVHHLSDRDSEVDEHGRFTSAVRKIPLPRVEDMMDPETTADESGWEPAMYRTRRRSETVRTVHHFPWTEDVDEQGRLLQVRKTARPDRDERATAKITDVGGRSRERPRIDTVYARRGVSTGDAGE